MNEDDFEMDFWNGCRNTYGEETKQLVYLNRMGFRPTPTWRSPVSFDGGGKSFVDIGGGPCSVLLKFTNLDPIKRSAVIDPGRYPEWVWVRYGAAGIEHQRAPGEALERWDGTSWDVALIYNCLQHCESPETIIFNAMCVAKELHMFEWVDIPPHEGHPHMLTEEALNRWTNRKGTVEQMNEGGCVGKAWYI